MSEAPDSQPEPTVEGPLVETQLVAWYFCASLAYLWLALAAGLLIGLQLVNGNPLPTLEWLSPGRWRMVHTNTIVYGFLANGIFGAVHWAIPRLLLRPFLSRKLSYFVFYAWQVIGVGMVIGILYGHAQGVELGESPTWIDPLVLVVWLLLAINAATPILRNGGSMYVSLWYFLAAYVWMFLTYAMGNFLPEYFVAGTNGGAIAGLFLHDLVGLFITPFGWGLMYYFVPILLKKPIWSHSLSLIGFWGLAFFYPLNGIHHFLYSPIPMFLQQGAIVATIAVEMVVTTVIVNFFATVWGTGTTWYRVLPLRWFYVGMVMYFLTCVQCAVQVTLTFQQLIHFTDWVVGHAHLVMFGVFSFWLFGIMTYLFPILLGAPWRSNALCEWHFWLSLVGIAVMVIDLTAAGVIQGFLWGALKPWDTAVEASHPFWMVRLITGVMIIAGQLCFLANLMLTWRDSRFAAAVSRDLVA
jgi:cytochrome c oxidase cbb3-type subunit I